MASCSEILSEQTPHVDSEFSSIGSTTVDLKTLVGDHTYAKLKCSFLPKGKGRPPDPPKLTLTNGLLLQLMLLKTEGNKTVKNVAVWFEKLFPDVSYPSSRLGGVLNRLMKRVTSMQKTGADFPQFLQSEVDFDFISSALSELGLKRGHLMGHKVLPEAHDGKLLESVTQGVIVDLENFRSKERLVDSCFTVKWVKKLTGTSESDKDLKAGIKNLMSCYKTLTQHQDNETSLSMLSAFLAMPFVVRKATQPTSKTTLQLPEPEPSVQESKEIKRLKDQIAELQAQANVFKEVNKDLSCDKMALLADAKEYQQQKKEVEKLEALVKEQKHKLQDLKPERLRYLTTTNAKLRAELRRMRMAQDRNQQQRRKFRDMKIKTDTLQKTHQRAVRRAKQRLQDLQRQYQQLHDAVQHQAEPNGIQDARQPDIRDHHNYRFSNNMRKTVMQLQSEGNVPASKCGQVFKVVAKELFGVTFSDKDLPCLQTAINMADEGHVLSKIQAAEEMLGAENFTLHTDGTSRGGKKITGHQITLDNGVTLSLGFSTVTNEDASSLLDLTVNILRELTDLYGDCQGNDEDKDNLFRTLLSKLTSVMTDRAAVMKSFDRKLLDFLQSELGQTATLHFLHCNAHFLLGMSRSVDVAVKMKEQELVETSGSKLGRDNIKKFQHFRKTETATARVIRLTSDITGPRGDEKNGCRAEWLAFCAGLGITSFMTSYRSNRFNCFFQAAAAIIYHHQHLHQFFNGGFMSHSNLKTESVAADLEDDNLMALVCAVALLYLQVTGPFFQLVQSTEQYCDFHNFVQKMEAFFDGWRNNAGDLLNPQFVGVFGDRFKLQTKMETAVFTYAAEHSVTVKLNLEFMMKEILLVTRLQLNDFLRNGKFGGELPVHIQEELEHCPLTNMLAENVFGEMDFDMYKRWNCSFHHRSSTQIMKHNKTARWLNAKGAEETSELLSTARRRAKQLRSLHRQQERLVIEKIKERLQENEHKKRMKEAETAQKKADIIRKVVALGGPCRTAADVTRLLGRLRQERRPKGIIKGALQDEIRYQKTVLRNGKDLRLSGTLRDLEQALKSPSPTGY